jgi:AraC-like DNA-binding protein
MSCIGISPENYNLEIMYVFVAKYDNCICSYHKHDYLEIKYVLAGEAEYNIENKLYKVKKGDVIILNPGINHIERLIPEKDFSELVIGINNICIRNLDKGLLISNDRYPVIKVKQFKEDFDVCIREILREQDLGLTGYTLMLKILIMKLVVILLREFTFLEAVSDSNQLFFESNDRAVIVKTINEYINENYMKDISLDKISKKTYLSPIYISKEFKDETGESPINHLIKFRLCIAVKLMEDDSISIKNIANMVGYHDAYYFSKLFKKYYKMSPTEYRKTSVKK